MGGPSVFEESVRAAVMEGDTTQSDGLPPWDERRKLYVGGLLDYPLWRLVPLWLRELARVGLTGGKDGAPVDVPPEPGAVSADAGDGRKVWIRPGAYHDEEGHPRAEVRQRYSRTDGAILAALAVLEGGEGAKRRDGELDEQTLRADYESRRGLRVAQNPVAPANERLLECATAAARHFCLDLDALPEQEHREVVVGFARKIHAIAKATRELQQYAERGRIGHTGDPARDVLAAELHELYGLSWPEVGRRLSMPQTDHDKAKHENQRARKAAERGRKLLDEASE